MFGSKVVEKFSDQREDRRNANSGTRSITDDAFWHKKGSEYVLRPSVVTQLQRLDEALMQPDAPPFKEVVGYIKRMLEPEMHKRIKALELCDLLKRTTFTSQLRRIAVEMNPTRSLGFPLFPPTIMHPKLCFMKSPLQVAPHTLNISTSPLATYHRGQVDTAATVRPAT